MCCPSLLGVILSISVWAWPVMCLQQSLEQSAPVLQVDTLRDRDFFGEDSLLTLPPSDELLKVGTDSLLSADRGVDVAVHTSPSSQQLFKVDSCCTARAY